MYKHIWNNFSNTFQCTRCAITYSFQSFSHGMMTVKTSRGLSWDTKPFSRFPRRLLFPGSCISNPSPRCSTGCWKADLREHAGNNVVFSVIVLSEQRDHELSSLCPLWNSRARPPRTLWRCFHISFVCHTGLGFFFSSKNFILDSKRYKARPKSLPVPRKEKSDVTNVTT